MDSARAASAETEGHEQAAAQAGEELMPIEDRYQDDGTLSSDDSMSFGLHTGRTTAMARIATAPVHSGDAETLLLAELTNARRIHMAMAGMAAALAATVALCLAL